MNYHSLICDFRKPIYYRLRWDFFYIFFMIFPSLNLYFSYHAHVFVIVILYVYFYAIAETIGYCESIDVFLIWIPIDSNNCLNKLWDCRLLDIGVIVLSIMEIFSIVFNQLVSFFRQKKRYYIKFCFGGNNVNYLHITKQIILNFENTCFSLFCTGVKFISTHVEWRIQD